MFDIGGGVESERMMQRRRDAEHGETKAERGSQAHGVEERRDRPPVSSNIVIPRRSAGDGGGDCHVEAKLARGTNKSVYFTGHSCA